MKTNVNIKMDVETRDKAKELFKNIGLDMTSAINIFLKAAIREKGIPFLITEKNISDVRDIEKRWAKDIKEAEIQEEKKQYSDFYNYINELKNEYELK